MADGSRGSEGEAGCKVIATIANPNLFTEVKKCGPKRTLKQIQWAIQKPITADQGFQTFLISAISVGDSGGKGR
jgi:hypothetical protein